MIRETIKKVWHDNSGFGEFIAPVIKAIMALAGCSIVLAILYTSIKLLASNTAQTVINVSP